MMGLVAIVAAEIDESVPESDLRDLVDAYQAIRGSAEVEVLQAGSWARVAVIRDRLEARIERSSDSWAVAVGRPVASGPLAETNLEEMEGQFALVTHHGGRQELTVAVDAFAMQALYIAEENNLTYVSTSALALARCLRRRPDRFALETFLRAGYHFGARTNWHGIRRLEPAESLTFGRGGYRRRTYWRFEVDRNVSRMDLGAAVEHCVQVAVEAYRQTLRNGGTWIDLTGGFDSRLMALLLEAAGVEFVANTRGSETGDDRVIAAAIAEKKGWELFSPILTEDWAHAQLRELEATVAWSDGHLQAFEPTWVLAVHQQLSRRHALLLSGGGGEHWRGFAWAQEFLRAGRSTQVNMDNWIDMRLLHPMRTDVFARDFTRDVRADLRERMSAWAAPYAEELNTIQLDVMYAYKMTGHFGGYRSADEAWLTAQLPFYLKQPFSAAVSVQHRHRASHRLMRGAIWRLDPDVARIVTSNGGPAMPLGATTAHRFAPYYVRIARRAATKLTQTALGRPLLPPRHAAWWAPVATRSGAVHLLGSSSAERRRTMRSLPLYNEEALDGFLSEPLGSPTFDADLLGRIVSIELMLRHADAALD